MAASGFFILLVSTLSCYEAQRRPLDPVKMPDHCRKPGEGKGFQIEGEWNEETYPIGKEAILACLPGYTNYRPIKLVCLAGDWIHVGKFQCKAFTCKLPQVDNGRVTYPLKPDYNSNDVIQITCNEGFYITNGVSTCTKDDWIPKPTCTEIVCNSYQHVEKGRLISVQAAYKYGEEIDVECDSGYILQTEPNKRRTCTSNGWSPPIRCVGVCVPSMDVLENAMLINQQYKYLEGEKATFQCYGNYKTPDGKSSGEMLCLPNGKFTPAKCSSYCEPPPAVQNAILNEQPKSSYAAGEKVTYTCNRGYSLEGSLTGEAQCENTQWMNVPVCRKIGEQCGPPPTVQFGDTTGIRKPSYKSGESVEYRCPNFYILKGETIVRCMNGAWEEAPVCLEISEQCGPPPTVQFGDTLGIRKPSYKSGESVEYRCPNYYILKGETIVRCMNGVWEEAPVCLEPCTAKEKDMEENKIQLRWVADKKVYSKHGDETEFVCKPGHEAPPGTQMKTTCQQGKLQYPKCFRNGFCVLQQATMITNNINSNMNNVVDPGQTIIFQCNEGMMPEDKLEAKCESGNINYPKCSSASKSAVYAESCQTPEIVNGFLKTERQDSYDSGSSVAFGCNENYVINGPINAKCKNGQWTDLPVCYRPCKISLEGLSESNIQLHSFYVQKGIPDRNYNHGTELLVSCKPGFKRPNQALLKIVCYDGKFKYPRCFSGNICRITQEGLDRNNLDLHEVHDNEVLYMECEKIYFKCKNGFYHWGQPTGTCAELAVSYPKCSASSSV